MAFEAYREILEDIEISGRYTTLRRSVVHAIRDLLDALRRRTGSKFARYSMDRPEYGVLVYPDGIGNLRGARVYVCLGRRVFEADF